MKRARVLLYAQGLLTLVCGVLTFLALKREAEIGWSFHRRLEEFFASPVVMGLYLACQLSCLAFPASVAIIAVGRVSAWRAALAVAASGALALLQFVVLEMVYPVRE
jgi:hypothetical protein